MHWNKVSQKMFKNRPMDHLFNELLKLDEARKWDLNYKKVFSEHVYSFNHSKLLLPEAWSICQIIIWAWNAPGWEYMFFFIFQSSITPQLFLNKISFLIKKICFCFVPLFHATRWTPPSGAIIGWGHIGQKYYSLKIIFHECVPVATHWSKHIHGK